MLIFFIVQLAPSGEKWVIRMRTLVLGMLLLAAQLALADAAGEKNAVIYKNEACGHCAPYLAEVLPVLTKLGYSVELKDFMNAPEARKELAEIQERFGVPLQYRGHMLMFLDGKYLFEGHVPLEAVRSVLENPPSDPVILYQDSMSPTDKFQIIKDGTAIECNVEKAFSECISASPIPQNASLLSHPWLLPALALLVPVAFLAKYGFN